VVHPSRKESEVRTQAPTGSTSDARERRRRARPTPRVSEPILLPKVRIWFADFPYLH
jgi:hypothetical protein